MDKLPVLDYRTKPAPDMRARAIRTCFVGGIGAAIVGIASEIIAIIGGAPAICLTVFAMAALAFVACVSLASKKSRPHQ